MGDQLFLLFTPKHSISRKTNAVGDTTDLHKVKYREGASWIQQLDELIGHDVNADFSKVVASVWMGQHSLVPNAFFQESKREALYTMDNALLDNCVLRHEAMQSIPYQVIFNVPTELESNLRSRFPTTDISSGFNYATTHWLQKNPDVPRVFVHLFENEFCLSCFEEDSLVFQNHYNYYSAEDILYYTLAAVRQYEFNSSETPIYLTGHLEKEGTIVKALRKYLPGVQIPPVPKAEASRNILQGNPQQFYHIFSLK